MFQGRKPEKKRHWGFRQNKPNKTRALLSKRILPEEAKKFLAAGPQTAITPTIQGYANRFGGRDAKTVEAILKDISTFSRKHYAPQTIDSAYAKRTAEEITRSRSVVIFGERVGGCLDYTVALCAALRAKGIPAKFIRFRTHALVHFFLDGKWFEADPMAVLALRVAAKHALHISTVPVPIKLVDEERLKQFEEAKAQHAYAEGLDAWDIGIKSFADFTKYEH